jgi:uncharacterized hydrophobic protein (TIGR00341 family)
MALRFMQIFIPDSEPAIPENLLEGREVLGRWRDSDTNHTVLHLLIPAEETEPVMDEFEKQYADAEGFHVVLLPVEATLPRPLADPNKKDQSAEQQGRKKKFGNVRISREELYNEVSETLGVTRIFISLTILSTVVAAIGLLRNDVAVIIGAMVIAPLLGPNVAMSLATTLGDTDLLRRALKTNLVGVASALAFAVLVGVVFTVNPETPAIASRTTFRVGDILLGLAAGAAGTLAFTHGISGAVIGVMVAVALVPPLVVCGMLLPSFIRCADADGGQRGLHQPGGRDHFLCARRATANLVGSRASQEQYTQSDAAVGHPAGDPPPDPVVDATNQAVLAGETELAAVLRAPVGQLHFDGLPATEVVDHRLERHGEWAVGGDELLFPLAAAERHGPHRDAVLLEL